MFNLINVEKAYLEMIYRIKLKRIARGYTQEEVSRTICREPHYLCGVELLHIQINTMQELQEIAWVLGDEELTSFFPREKDRSMLKVMIEDEVVGARRIHRCTLLTEEAQTPFFLLQEELQPREELVLN
jgi:transcriptional regulator with XRE-family HTH domain